MVTKFQLWRNRKMLTGHKTDKQQYTHAQAAEMLTKNPRRNKRFWLDLWPSDISNIVYWLSTTEERKQRPVSQL